MKKAIHLLSCLDKIRGAMDGKFLYLFLDYDGTLAPISKTPDEAKMPDETKDALGSLSGKRNCKLAIISGRAIGDIRRKVRLKKDVIYVGNHGFEIRGPKIKFKSPVPPRYRKTLEEIKFRLEKQLFPFKGAFVEDKGFSLCVHYRLVDRKLVSKVRTEFYAILTVYEVKGEVRLKSGKKMLEVRPPVAWDKGKVVLWLLARQKFFRRENRLPILPIYIGDDLTDEDAFEALKGRGLTVFVGTPKKTKAKFYLKDTKEVSDFLKIVLKDRSRR